jgi:hypothetical protein
MGKAKIFGIGLAKTGTTSLNDAFAILGIASIGCPASISDIRRFEAATDGIVADRFEELDRVFPHSKFIYTVRDRDSWLQSYTGYRGRKHSPMPGHEEMTSRLYGTTGTDEQTLIEAYARHERHVLEYFRERPDDLLVMDICGGRTDWETLCAFLGKPVPEEPFPSSNPKFTDNIYLQLLYCLKDPGLVSQLTRAPVEFLESLSLEGYDPGSFTREAPTKRTDRILLKTVKHFGGIDQAARALQLEPAMLTAAVERHQQRKADRPRRKSTFIGKRIRRLKRRLELRSR